MLYKDWENLRSSLWKGYRFTASVEKFVEMQIKKIARCFIVKLQDKAFTTVSGYQYIIICGYAYNKHKGLWPKYSNDGLKGRRRPSIKDKNGLYWRACYSIECLITGSQTNLGCTVEVSILYLQAVWPDRPFAESYLILVACLKLLGVCRKRSQKYNKCVQHAKWCS